MLPAGENLIYIFSIRCIIYCNSYAELVLTRRIFFLYYVYYSIEITGLRKIENLRTIHKRRDLLIRQNKKEKGN